MEKIVIEDSVCALFPSFMRWRVGTLKLWLGLVSIFLQEGEGLLFQCGKELCLHDCPLCLVGPAFPTAPNPKPEAAPWKFPCQYRC